MNEYFFLEKLSEENDVSYESSQKKLNRRR